LRGGCLSLPTRRSSDLDVASGSDVAALVAAARERFGSVNGVIHSAGTLRDGFVRGKSDRDFAAVLAPKVEGTRHLDEALRDEPLDLFVLFSSLSATLGNAGQADYCAAGAFQDGYAILRERLREHGARSGRTLSIGWPYWSDGGMAVHGENLRLLREELG